MSVATLPSSSKAERAGPSAPANPPASGASNVVISCLLLVAATLVFYNPIIHNQFTGFDDWNYILKNPHVQSGLTWDTVKWSFTTFQEGNWHPLSWLSHALDCQIFHLNAVGHHYTSLLFHAANAVLLFLLLWRATGSLGSSLMVAALFALHPVNVESVAWASERKNVLSMFFFLLALHAYDRYARTGRRALYGWLVFLFVLGLMAKPQIVTLPFVLLLWDYWPLQRIGYPASDGMTATSTPRSLSFLLWEKLPLFVLTAVDSVVTAIAQRAGNAVRTVSEFSVPARLENAVVSYIRYLGKAFWPSRLAPMYPRPEGLLPAWQVVGAAALLLLISALVFHWRDRRSLAAGWCWFLGTLVPMIGLITVGDQAMADRYAYLPFIGLFIAVVWTVEAVANARRIQTGWRVGCALVVLLMLGGLTYRQLGYWQNDDILWHYTVRVTDRNYVAHNNLALMLAKAGRSEEAVVEFRTAKSLHKYPPNQILSLAIYELRVGHAQQAVEDCREVLASSSDPRLQGAALTQMGRAFLQLRRYDEAAASYRSALALQPKDEDALVGSGVLALRSGDFRLAVERFLLAAQVNPSDVNFLLLAQALHRSGQTAEGERAEAQARSISANFTEAKQAVAAFLDFAGLKSL